VGPFSPPSLSLLPLPDPALLAVERNHLALLSEPDPVPLTRGSYRAVEPSTSNRRGTDQLRGYSASAVHFSKHPTHHTHTRHTNTHTHALTHTQKHRHAGPEWMNNGGLNEGWMARKRIGGGGGGGGADGRSWRRRCWQRYGVVGGDGGGRWRRMCWCC
jgi:hypothetical protein